MISNEDQWHIFRMYVDVKERRVKWDDDISQMSLPLEWNIKYDMSDKTKIHTVCTPEMNGVITVCFCSQDEKMFTTFIAGVTSGIHVLEQILTADVVEQVYTPDLKSGEH